MRVERERDERLVGLLVVVDRQEAAVAAPQQSGGRRGLAKPRSDVVDHG
jgi:hypothetical protein